MNNSTSNPTTQSYHSPKQHYQINKNEYDDESHSKFLKNSSSFKDALFVPYSISSNGYLHDGVSRIADTSLGTIQGGDPSLLGNFNEPSCLYHKSLLVDSDKNAPHYTAQNHSVYCPVHGELDVKYLNDISKNNPVLISSPPLKGGVNSPTRSSSLKAYRSVDVRIPAGLYKF